MSGVFAFNRVGPQVTYGIERIDNYRPLFSVSGTLAIQLWATALPYNGSGSLFGYKLTETSIGRLNGGFYFSDIVRTQTFFEPPPGNYNIVFVLAEWNGFNYVTVDWNNFSVRQTFGPIVVAPSITAQPQGFSLNVGQSGLFAVEASGTAPLYYQWYKNDFRIDGATQSTLSIIAARTSDAGSYTVRVTNQAGSVQSDAANLTVNQPVATRLDHKRNSNGSLTLTWTGSGKLVFATKPDGAFADVTGAKSGYTVLPSGQSGFYKIIP